MKKHFNYPLFFLIVCLVGFAFLFLACLTAPSSMQKYGNTNHFLFHQLFFGLVPALIFAFLAYKIPLSFIKKWALPPQPNAKNFFSNTWAAKNMVK